MIIDNYLMVLTTHDVRLYLAASAAGGSKSACRVRYRKYRPKNQQAMIWRDR